MTKQQWERELSSFPEANFLQSWEWGEFHRKLGHSVYRISFNGGMLLGIVEPARRGRYLEVAGGPLLSNYASLSLWKQAVLLMKEVAKKERCVFIRIRPQIELQRSNLCGLQRLDLCSLEFRPAPMHLHAELTRVLDLTKIDEQLLLEMRKSTRYEIKRALKMGIKVEISDDENLVDDFVRLQEETAQREDFVQFSRRYLLEQFKAFKKKGSASWFWVSNPTVISSDRRESRDPAIRSKSAAAGGLDSSTSERNISPSAKLYVPSLGMTHEIISMAFVIFYRGEAVYHYAASSDEARKIPAAYAIQWAITAEARKRGCKTYNLWGDVADNQIGRHRFSGPSLFKRGFGGEQIQYLHAQDLPLSWKYWINWGVEIARKNFRSL